MNRYTIFAGVNGAGKSTLYHQYYKPYKNEQRINTDEMVAKIGSFEDGFLQLKCGKEAVRLINYYFNQNISFNQETTLTGKSILKNIKRARDLGYEIHLYYVGLDNVEVALKRIDRRVKHGGHGILEQDVRRRYSNSFENLNEIFQYCDKILFWDNTEKMNIVAMFDDGNLVFKSKLLPDWLKKNELLATLYDFYFG